MLARERKFSTGDLFAAVKQVLLQYGYEGFTFRILADQLEVSRGAIYKYYENKDDLITDFMVYEMGQFIGELKGIEKQQSFAAQFDFLIDLIFQWAEVHQLIGIAQRMIGGTGDGGKENKERLKRLPLELYGSLRNFIALGKEEGILKPHIPDSLMLGFIFQSIAIPNHYGIPQAEWVSSMKEIISRGMFTTRS